jgi:salicylate hydroxylase
VPVEKLPKGTDLSSTHLWLGKGGHVVSYPVRGQTKLNIVAITPQSCASDITQRTMNAEPQALKDFYSSWCKEVRQLLDTAPDWSGWPLNPVNPRGKWSKGCMVLIGDAAHATLPYAAQGGVAAIEDAAVLAKAFEEEGKDPAKAMAAFEKLRKPRATKVWDLAQTNRKIYHMSGPAAFVRDTVLRTYNAERLHRRMDWLFGWKI